MQTITPEDAQAHLSDLLNQVVSAESFPIVQQGEVRAVPHSPQDLSKNRVEVIRNFKEYVQKRGFKLNGLSIQELRDEGRR